MGVISGPLMLQALLKGETMFTESADSWVKTAAKSPTAIQRAVSPGEIPPRFQADWRWAGRRAAD